MKLTTKLISFLLTISSIFLLSACGVPTSKTTLKVTNSMAIGNNTYKGGLVFYGRSAGGKFFSAPIKYDNTNNSNTAEIVLDKGVWTFAAVGWTNTTSSPLQGTSECAVTTVNLDADNKTVILDLEPSNCNNAEFGGNFSSNQFGLTNIVTCGSFYTNTTTTIPLPLSATNNNIDYCSTNTNISPDLKIWAKSAKLRVPAIVPGEAPLPNSDLFECVTLDDGRSTTAPLFRLPAKGVPVMVELFDSNDCTTDKSAAFEFRKGLKSDYGSFDHKYFTDTITFVPALYLLNTISKRGSSSLMASVPNFSCGAGATGGATTAGTNYDPCILIPKPTGTGTKVRFISNDQPIYIDNVSDTKSCSKLSSFEKSGATAINYNSSSPSYKCEEKNDKILFTFKGNYLTSNSGFNCANSCSTQFNFTQDDLSIVSTIIDFEIQNNDKPSLAAYNQIFSLIGHEDIITSTPSESLQNGIDSLQTFFESNDGENRHFGVLSQIRELFQPGAIGGLFNQFHTSTTIAGKSANVALWEEGVLKSFRIDVESDNTETPDYLRDNQSPYPANDNNPSFTNKITVSKIIGGTYYPETIIRWVHGKKVGSLESKDIETKDGKTSLSRSLIFWNTESLNHARFEVYNYEKKTNSTSPYTLLNERTSFLRAEREATPGQGNARLESFSYDSSKDNSNSNYYQSARKSGTFLKDARAIYVNSNLETTKQSGDPDLFARHELAPFVHSKSLTSEASSALSPNGQHLVSSWIEHNGTNWIIKILRRGPGGRVIESLTTGATTEQPVTKVTINNQGHATVAFVIKTTTTIGGTTVPLYSLYSISWTGSSWKYFNGSVNVGSTISSGVLTNLTAFLASTNKIAFDLIDSNPSLAGNPAPTMSDKHLIFSELDPSIDAANPDWKLKKISFSSENWGTGSFFTNPLSHQPILISAAKNSSDYHISLIMNNSGFKIQTMKTTNFGTPSISSLVSIGIEAGSNPSDLFSKYNTVSGKTDIIISSDSNKIYRKEFIPGTSTLNSFLPDIYSKFNEIKSYCFDRIRNGSIRPKFDVNPETTSCNLPDSSYAPAIQSTVLIDHDDDEDTEDIDAGFKHDIQSLNPETFKYLFTMP